MKNITIINAYGVKNIGDAAIQDATLIILNKLLNKEVTLSILCENESTFKPNVSYKGKILTYQLPYGYAIRSKTKKVSYVIKLFRLFEVILFTLYYTVLGKLNINMLPKKGFYSYIKALHDTDVVLGSGGGYFTSRTKFTDYFGLLLTLIPIYVAKFYNKRILLLPMSFGTFASDIQKQLVFNSLSNTTFIARDEFSKKELSQLSKSKKNIKILKSFDLALYNKWLNKYDIDKKYNSKYIVITLRDWLNNQQQKKFERELAGLIDKLWEEKKIKTVFIPMAQNKIEDDDNLVAKRVKTLLINKDIFEISNISTPNEVQYILKKARFAICNRLHSAILATTTYTPFITIAYASKTKGFLKDMDLLEWNIDMNDFNQDKLYNSTAKLNNKRSYRRFVKTLINKSMKIEEQKTYITSTIKQFINYI